MQDHLQFPKLRAQSSKETTAKAKRARHVSVSGQFGHSRSTMGSNPQEAEIFGRGCMRYRAAEPRPLNRKLGSTYFSMT